jgi:tripartite-type tricarboxylate transporter receptor subunit TctC
MMFRSLRCLAAGILVAVPSLCALAADAADYPAHPVRMALPFPPGGSADSISRALAERLQSRFGQPFLIENRPGAAGNVATRYVVKAQADGYFLLVGVTGAMTINPTLYGNLDYDPQRDLVAISMVARGPVVIVAGPDSGIATLNDMIARVKADPSKYTFATNGVGTSHHLAAELFKQRLGLDMRNIPYKGTPEALQDIIGGRVPIGFMDLTASLPLIASGRLKALATTGTERSTALPDVPTVSEAAAPGFAADTWVGLFAPKGTPAPVVSKLSLAINEALREPGLRKQGEGFGLSVEGSTPEALQQYVRDETRKWKAVITAADIKL